jgi:hypothetical protein
MWSIYEKKKVTSFLTYVEGLSVDKTLLNCYGIKVYSIRLLTLEDSNFLSLQYPGTSPTNPLIVFGGIV